MILIGDGKKSRKLKKKDMNLQARLFIGPPTIHDRQVGVKFNSLYVVIDLPFRSCSPLRYNDEDNDHAWVVTTLSDR
jgi:hypothetical protein